MLVNGKLRSRTVCAPDLSQIKMAATISHYPPMHQSNRFDLSQLFRSQPRHRRSAPENGDRKTGGRKSGQTTFPCYTWRAPSPSEVLSPMPRRARIVVAGYPMHVILRGIDRAAVFFEDDDRRFFLESAGRGGGNRSGGRARLCADDQPPSPADDTGPRPRGGGGDEAGRSAVRPARQPDLPSHRGSFEGRFRSSLIEVDGYLLACQR